MLVTLKKSLHAIQNDIKFIDNNSLTHFHSKYKYILKRFPINHLKFLSYLVLISNIFFVTYNYLLSNTCNNIIDFNRFHSRDFGRLSPQSLTSSDFFLHPPTCEKVLYENDNIPPQKVQLPPDFSEVLVKYMFQCYLAAFLSQVRGFQDKRKNSISQSQVCSVW